jgi:hypothetical protein
MALRSVVNQKTTTYMLPLQETHREFKMLKWGCRNSFKPSLRGCHSLNKFKVITIAGKQLKRPRKGSKKLTFRQTTRRKFLTRK